jgi:hypothetical protein
VSRDRETDPSGTSSTSNIRFRNQSPSASHRRSRERERIDRDTLKEINHSINQCVDLGLETYDETRMNDELLGYTSLTSEDLEHPDNDIYKQQSGSLTRHNRTNSLQAIDRLTTKIACTKESIRKEQTARDGKNLILNDFFQ